MLPLRASDEESLGNMMIRMSPPHGSRLSPVKALIRSTVPLVLGAGMLVPFGAPSCHARVQDWTAAEAESVGLDAGLIDALAEEAEAGSFRNLHSLLVVKGGR